MSKHLLVTNDFLPKVGGIQNYLFDLWSELPPDSFAVYTTQYPGDQAFDSGCDFQVIRSRHRWLGPYPWLVRRIRSIAEQVGATHLIFDPAWPLGFIAPTVGLPYAVVLHGAEAVIPASVPGLATMFRRAVNNAELIIGAGQYPLTSCPDGANRVVIPPVVDTDRFCPVSAEQKRALRASLGIEPHEFLISGVSRLVSRKGFDLLTLAVQEVSKTHPVKLLIAGSGKQKGKLLKLANASSGNVKLLGRIADQKVVELYQASDAMAMICHDRWFGLEQEGFGIVFLEAGACGVPQIAGRSGGSHEAVIHGESGLVVEEPTSVKAVAKTIEFMCTNPSDVQNMAIGARRKAELHSSAAVVRDLKASLEEWIEK